MCVRLEPTPGFQPLSLPPPAPTVLDHQLLPPLFNMASHLSTLPSQPVTYESVESLRAQIKEIEDKWNDELERLGTACKDKEELERILHVLETLVDYERAATLKTEVMLQETRNALGIPDEAGCPTLEAMYDPSRSTGSSSSGGSSRLEFDLVYNPNAALPVPLQAPQVSPPPPLLDKNDQAPSVSPLLETPARPTSKQKRSPGWKSRITSILISTNHHNRTNPHSPLSHTPNSTSPFFDGAGSRGVKPKRAARTPKRPSQEPENHSAADRRRIIGSAGSKFANRANRDVSRKQPNDLTLIPQS